jgi:hypothetical protein
MAIYNNTMFYDENTERALLHRNTDRRQKFDNKPLIKSFTNPTYERKIGGSNGVTRLKKSSSEVPPLAGMGKARPKKKTDWMEHVAKYYKSSKEKDPSYTYKQAMQDASKNYKP